MSASDLINQKHGGGVVNFWLAHCSLSSCVCVASIEAPFGGYLGVLSGVGVGPGLRTPKSPQWTCARSPKPAHPTGRVWPRVFRPGMLIDPEMVVSVAQRLAVMVEVAATRRTIRRIERTY